MDGIEQSQILAPDFRQGTVLEERRVRSHSPKRGAGRERVIEYRVVHVEQYCPREVTFSGVGGRRVACLSTSETLLRSEFVRSSLGPGSALSPSFERARGWSRSIRCPSRHMAESPVTPKACYERT